MPVRRRIDTTTMEQALRKRYNIGARKIPYEERDVAHAVIAEEDDRGFFDVIGANDDPDVSIGENVTYSVELTDDEAERFRQARNCRFVEEDQVDTVDEVTVTRAAQTTSSIPPPSTMTYMGAGGANVISEWHGRDVSIGVMDGGTTKAVKDRFGWNVVLHKDFVDTSNTDPNRITVEHGCYVTPEAVPANGQLVEAVVFTIEGVSYHSVTAAAMRWFADNGVKVVNYSGSGSSGSGTQQDAIRYMYDRGVVLVCSAGNSGRYELGYPAKYCETFTNVYSSIAFVESTDLRADFSNHLDTGSGCAPGSRCLSVNKDAVNIRWSGTSSSSPKMALLVAMGATGGRYTTTEVARALVVNARNTVEPTSEEGAGAWFLENALRKLGAFDPPPEPEPAPAPEPEPEPSPYTKSSMVTMPCVKARVRRARHAAAKVMSGSSLTSRGTSRARGLWRDNK